MDYFLKANAILVIFILCYKLFLKNETFYQANRFFLLCGLALTVIVPFIVIPITVELAATGNALDLTNITTFEAETQDTYNTFTLTTILKGIYYLGVFFFLIQFLIEIISVVRILRTTKKTSDGVFTFIETDSNYTAFSFFKYIIYNPAHFKTEELSSIILHEKIHAKQYHTIDVLFAKVITILFWFNPFVWLYKKLLQQNLEFIADDKTASLIKNPSVYQNLLLKTFLSNPQLTVVNTFYNSSIKKRIIMLQKTKSNSAKAFKLAIVLPFLALFLMSFNTEEVYISSKTNQNLNQKSFLITPNSTDKDLARIEDYFKTSARVLKFKNVKRNADKEITHLILASRSQSNKTFIDHLNMSDETSETPIKSFKLALSDDNKGIKMASLLSAPGGTIEEFIIKEKVTVSKFSPKNNIDKEQKSSNTETAETTTYYFENKGDDLNLKLKPAPEENANYTLKINTTNNQGEKSKLKITEIEKTPLYILDDKEVSKEIADNLNTELIDSINILKGKEAISKYGDKGKNGVIIITTKTYANKTKAKVFIKSSNTEITLKDLKKPLLIFINNKESTQLELDVLNPNTIESINVLKEKNAIKRYGEKGKNGAIIVKTK